MRIRLRDDRRRWRSRRRAGSTGSQHVSAYETLSSVFGGWKGTAIQQARWHRHMLAGTPEHRSPPPVTMRSGGGSGPAREE
jgi:hypothetical protein